MMSGSQSVPTFHLGSSEVSTWSFAGATVGVVFAGLLVMFWDTIVALVHVWKSTESYGHGFLILPVSAYLAARQRQRLVQEPPKPDIRALPVLILVTCGGMFASLVDVQALMQTSFIVLIGISVWAILGIRAAVILAFPVGYLMFAVPVWSVLVPHLQAGTTMGVTGMLHLFGIPVLLEGNHVSIPSGKFIVTELCAGLKYLLAAMSIAALYIYIYFRSVTRALIFFIVCVGLAVVYNWFRAVVIVIIGHLSEMQSPLVSSHRSLGWALFVSVIILMFLVGAWLKRGETRSENDRAGSLFLGNPASAAARSSVIGMAFTVLLIVGIGFTTAARMKGRVPEHYTVIPPEGIQIPGWSGTLSEQVDWQPMSVGADASWISVYGNGDKRVSLYVAYYFRQTQGKELINDRNRLYDRTVWTLVGRSRLRLNTDKEVNLEVIETKLSGPGDRLRTLWHWYEIGGHTTASPSVAKLYQVGGLIRGRPGAAAVAIALDHSNTNGEHRETLRRFALSLDPVLSQALRKMVVREP